MDNVMSTTTAVQAVSESTALPDVVGNVSIREIHKNGWLKKLPSSDRRSSPFAKVSKAEKLWVVFCIHDDVNAFLEFYENRRNAFSHQPLSSLSLATCLHVSPSIVFQEDEFIFTIVLNGRSVALAAVSREQMIEWIDALKSKLTEIGVLTPRYNLYTKPPEIKPLLATNRDPNSPLPPPPPGTLTNSSVRDISTVTHSRAHLELSASTSTSLNRSHNATASQSNVLSYLSRIQNMPVPCVVGINRGSSAQPPSQSSSLLISSVPCSMSASSATSAATRPSLTTREYLDGSGSSAQSTDTHFISNVAISSFTTSATATNASNNSYDDTSTNSYSNENGNNARSVSTNEDPVNNSSDVESATAANQNGNLPMMTPSSPDSSIYEPLFLACSLNRVILGGIRNPSYHNPPVSSVSRSTLPLSPPSVQQRQRAQSEERRARRSQPIRANGNLNLRPGEGNNTGIDENRRPLTLREKQVLLLSWEIKNRGGVRVLLPRKDCSNTIAFIEIQRMIWIAGWKQREHPFLYHSFHIGDRVLTVNGHDIRNVQDINTVIKSEPNPKVEFIISRVPHGQVFALKRENDGQDLGLVREGNTANIVEVVQGGLASRCGLPAKAVSFSSVGPCNWVLTEINGRPLNLFFKENEIQDRLNAVGRDISILVQPSDFIKALRKNLKTMKNYKDYIVQ